MIFYAYTQTILAVFLNTLYSENDTCTYATLGLQNEAAQVQPHTVKANTSTSSYFAHSKAK
jgi:hypothetical protein